MHKVNRVEAERLRRAGMSLREAAAALGVSHMTVARAMCRRKKTIDYKDAAAAFVRTWRAAQRYHEQPTETYKAALHLALFDLVELFMPGLQSMTQAGK